MKSWVDKKVNESGRVREGSEIRSNSLHEIPKELIKKTRMKRTRSQEGETSNGEMGMEKIVFH